MQKSVSYFLALCIVLSLGLTSFAEPEPAALKQGDIIEFGSYEQDNIIGNGPEPIEWQVLDVDGNEAFLVSVHSLDAMKFNETMKSSAKKTLKWAESDIRSWLNGEFIDKAFSEEEKNCLAMVENEEGVMDQAFLPSWEEIEKFFPTAEVQFSMPTEYAFVKQGDRDMFVEALPTFDVNQLAWHYVLRSFNSTGRKVALAPAKGMLTEDADNVIHFIRPAIKIDTLKAFTVMDKLNSQYIEISVTDPDEINFLKDMASGINKRLLSADTESTAGEFGKLVAYELDEISKYESVTFPDADFDEFAHDYIDACQLQQKAIESFNNKTVFEPLWQSGRILRAELIAKGYEKYGLDIREEDYLNYKNATNPDNNSSSGTGSGPSFEFLEGYWSSRNGMHTFEMKSDRSYVTTVPVVPHCGDTYILDNGVIRSYYANNPSQKTDNLKITVVSDTEIDVYSYQTKTSYTLIKRR